MSDKEWNHLAIRMGAFHAHFRQQYKTIYALADSFEKRGLSFPRFIEYALSFDEGLTFHHTIEERMPEFRPESEHPESHRKIHEGLEHYCDYLREVKSAPNKYEPAVLRSRMDAFSTILFSHLDAEEKCLRKPNMEKYWTLEEIKKLPM